MSEVIEAPEKTVASAAIKPKGQPTLMPESMGLAESKRHDWVVDVSPGWMLEQVMEPAFWAHVAPQMEPLDRIEVRWEDCSMIAHLRVLYCERTYAKVALISKEDYGRISAEIPDSALKHRIEFKGTTLKFAVIRNSDNAMIQSGFKERTQAIAWMQDHERQ